jgi:hypothetical protein
MPAAIGRLAGTITDLTDAPRIAIQNYTIDHVAAAGTGTTTDGTAGVFLAIGPDVVQAPYLDSLTAPTAGQTVRVLMVDNSPLILGRLIGLPNI